MAGDMLRLTIAVVCALMVLFSLVQLGEANYKNAPMNGIMFGKRGPSGKKMIKDANGLLGRASRRDD